jgi:alanine dehydrogenase
MLVGVPKEIKTREFRVGLVPSSVAELVHRGHQVLVETNAGIGIGASDDEYRAAGADIAATAGDVFAKADMIVKVKEPQPDEWVQLSPNQILFTYLHLAADAPQAYGLAKSGCTAIAYETITDDQGGLPLLAPMSEGCWQACGYRRGITSQSQCWWSWCADFGCSGNRAG